MAMVKILMLILGVDKATALVVVIGLIAVTSFISTMSGLWGVLVADVVQFFIKMAMVVILAYCAVDTLGGMDQMLAKVHEIDRAKGIAPGGKGGVLSFVPDLDSPWMPMITFLAYISINWWAV